MVLHVVGGVYREHCIHPHWNEIYGSAGRAALAIANFGTPVTLHSYMTPEALQIINEKACWFEAPFEVDATEVSDIVKFTYLHDMAMPDIRGIPIKPHPPLVLKEEKIVRFGMLEGDAKIHAEWAVYDPQNGSKGRPFRENGSSANRLAIVLNSYEAGHLAGLPGESPAITSAALARQEGADVVVVKMGPEGAFVWSLNEAVQIPALRTSRVWKIGSGDCFVGHFANAWMYDSKTPVEAVEIASRATAYYCETQGFPGRESDLRDFSPVELSTNFKNGVRRRVYVAGPFFDLAQIWMVQQVRSGLLALGLRVFSPYHDIGLGGALDVVERDLEAIRNSDLVLALTDGLDVGTIYEIGYARALNKPVIVYCERHKGENLKMMEGSGCIICTDYATALYTTVWEAIKI